MTFAVLGLGSNKSWGGHEPLELLAFACAKLKKFFVSNFSVSCVYLSKAMYVENQPDFHNMCVSGFTEFSAAELLQKIHEVEASLGRDRKKETRNGPRPIDIDIELYGNERIDFYDSDDNMKNLQIPHPRLQERAFVLLPLLDILPEDSDILNKVQVLEWLSKISEKNGYEKDETAKKLVDSADFWAIVKKREKMMADLLVQQTLVLENSENTEKKEKRRYTAGQFEGPLDLLWTLIRDNKINIYDIPVSTITEQFLEYLDYAASFELSDLSEFYSMAARLIYIKSKMMLPSDVKVDDDLDFDDPREELVDTLIEYQKFKKLSSLIEEKQDESEWTFERKKIQRILPFEEEDLWQKVDTWDLLEQMQKMFKNLVSQYSDEKILDMYEEISVNEKLTLMNELIEEKGECMFTDLIVRKGNLLDVICAFMALLEAVKFKRACIYQNRLFGDIKITEYTAA